MFSHLLRLLLVSLLATQFIFPQSLFAQGYIGEDLGTDLYRKVDEGFGVTKKSLVGKRLVGSTARLNAAIQKQCKTPPNTSLLVAGKDFTNDELTELEGGSVAPLANHLSSTAKAGLESDILACIRDVIRSDYAKIRRETSREQQTLNSLGNIGLYTDGSLKNSSFDLMKDLEQIHDVIFAKDIPYTGTPNTSATSLGSFFASPLALTEGLSQGATLDDRLSRDLADAGWRLNQPTSSSSGAQTPTLAALCASGTLLGGMDAGLLADLQRQTAFGNNEGSQTLPGDLQGNDFPIGVDTVTGPGEGAQNALQGVGGSSRFGCTGFFCIKVDFIMYNGLLLMGTKNYSIESILQQNLKIVNHFAGSSFIQAKHTNNFFDLLLKNIDLPSMSHIGVVVSSLPAPILNLPAKKTPRGTPFQTDAQKEFTEMKSGVFKDYGIDVRRANALSSIANNEKDLGISYLEGLTSDFTNAKFTPGRSFRSEYASLKEASIKNEYASGFSDDILQFEAFTKAFVNHLGNFVSLVKKLDEIPQN